MLLPSKHVGTRNDHRHRDRAALHTNEPEVGTDETWGRDDEAAARLRDYCAAVQEEEE
jgi:hypothetical protein